MTVVKMQNGDYIGLSTDDKPTSDVPPGTKFTEHDNDRLWLYDGTSWREIEIVVLDSPHKWIHEGKMWAISGRFLSIADNANADMVLEVGSIGLHVIWETRSAGDHHGSIHEAPTVTTAGDPATVSNQNRNIGDDGAPVGKKNPTITGTGLELLTWLLPGGTGGQASGGERPSREEIILASNTTYLFRATNKKGQAADMCWVLHAYEHD